MIHSIWGITAEFADIIGGLGPIEIRKASGRSMFENQNERKATSNEVYE